MFEIYSPPTASQHDAISVKSNDDSSENQWQEEDIKNSIITNIEVASSVKRKRDNITVLADNDGK